MENFAKLRKQMVETQLIGRGITDDRVLRAFLDVPRHKFVPEKEIKTAYADFPLPIGHGQTISQPYMVALMTECLKLKGDERVLEIGTGSGYQTAILASLCKEVYTIDRIPELVGSAKKTLGNIGYDNIEFKTSDGTLGWIKEAPFDGIIVTAGSPKVPKALVNQLGKKGYLVIPIGNSLSQMLTVIEKNKEKITSVDVCSCVFVPLIGEEGWKK